MAQVPVVPGPSVAPSTQAVPTQNVNPSGAFGAQTAGEGLSDFGKTASQVSDSNAQTALAYQAVTNKATTDIGFGNFAKVANQAALDYQNNNKGFAAGNNYNQFVDNLETQRQAIGEGMNPMARAEYDSATRQTAGRTLTAVKTFASSEYKSTVLSSAQYATKTAQDQGLSAFMSGDSQGLADSIATISKNMGFLASAAGAGWSDEEGTYKTKEAVGTIFQSAIKQKLDDGDHPAAAQILAEHKNDMTPDQVNQIMGAMRASGKAYTNAALVDSFFKGGINTNPAALDTGIAKAEGGLNSDGTGRTSPQGAVGKFQVLPTTAAQYGVQVNGHTIDPNNRDDVAVLRDNTALNTQAYSTIRDDLMEKYNNNPAVVALAYHGGQGAANAMIQKYGMPQPGQEAQWAAKIPGPKDQAYVKSILDSVGPAGPGFSVAPNEDPAAAKDRGLTQALAQSEQIADPIQRQQFLSGVEQKLNLLVSVAKDGQDAAVNRLLAPIVSADGQAHPPITTTQDLFKAYSGAAGDFSSLPPARQMQVESAINQGMYRQPNAVQLEARNQAVGLRDSQPYTFANADLSKLPLTPADQAKMYAEQMQLKSKQADDGGKAKEWLSNPVIGQYYKANFQDHNSPEALQYLGAVSQAVTQQETLTGKPVTQTDLAKIGSNLALTRPVNGATLPAYAVPGEAAGVITAKIAAHNAGPGPKLTADPQTISRIYHANPSAFDKQAGIR